MINKKQVLALLLSAATITVPSYCADLNDLVKQLPQLESKVIESAKSIAPAAQEIVNALQNGDFAKLENALNSNLVNLDLSPAITFLQNNMDTIKGAIQQGINYIPSEYRKGKLKTAINTAQAMINNTGLKSQLESLKKYSTINANKISQFVTALKDVASSETAKAAVKALAKDIQEFANQVTQADIQAIKDASNIVVQSVQEISRGGEIDLDKVGEALPGLKQLLHLAPALQELIGKLYELAMTIKQG